MYEINKIITPESCMKIDEKKEHHPIYHLGKMYDAMKSFQPASIKDYKDSHQFSCKIQVITLSDL